MTGTCPPCREDKHEAHQGTYTVETRRKGHGTGSRKVVCACPCLQPEGWRGVPQNVPRWESVRR